MCIGDHFDSGSHGARKGREKRRYVVVKAYRNSWLNLNVVQGYVSFVAFRAFEV